MITAATRTTQAVSRAHRSRGFTLIEVVLAGMLSAIVAGACLGFVFTLTRADAASAERTAVMVDMSRIHRAFQHTFRTMLLDTTPPKPGDARQARIALLEGGLGPRLELTLMRPPVLGVIDGKPMSLETQHSAAVGALELRRPIKILSDGSAMTDESSLELWWTPYAQETGKPELDQRQQAKGVRIAGNIQSMGVSFYRTGENKTLERQRTAEIAGWDQVPAYVEASVQMTDGQQTSWLFEVAAQGGRTPGPVAGGGGYSADADLPRDITDRLQNELAGGGTSKPPTNTDPGTGTGTGTSAFGGGPGTGNPQARDPAADAQRLREALAMAMRLIARLNGGGGGDE